MPKIVLAIRFLDDDSEPHITELDEKESVFFLKRWVKPYMDTAMNPDGSPMLPMPETGYDEEVVGEATIGRIRFAMREEVAKDLTQFLNTTEPMEMDKFLEEMHKKEKSE